MRKVKKPLSVVILTVLALSLLCGCDNGNTDNTGKDVSQGGSSALSDTSDNTSSESSKKDKTSAESSIKGESSFDSDYEEMMKYVNQLSADSTEEEIHKVLGIPDREEEKLVLREYYDFGKYTIEIMFLVEGNRLDITNNETQEKTNIIFPTKPTNPYNENSDYDSKVKELVNKVSSITPNSTREDVLKILGKPDKTEKSGIQYDTYNFGKYDIMVTYYNGGLDLVIWNTENYETIDVVYPK